MVKPQMNTDVHRFEERNDVERSTSKPTDTFIYKKHTYEIIGGALQVLNELGHGLHEKPYENALVVECRIRNIPVLQQKRFNVTYKGHFVAEYIPDLILYDSIVVDTKTIDRITQNEIGQMINYLKITTLRVGLILNFKHPKLEWKRVTL